MLKRWLTIILLFLLGGLIAAYVLATTDLPGRIYTPEQQTTLVNYNRLRLTQTTPLWNTYVYAADARADLSAVNEPAVGAVLGATSCRVRATLDARYEESAGISVTAYDLDFEGTYRLLYSGPDAATVLEVVFPFPAGLETLNQVRLWVDGEEPSDAQYSLNSITWRTVMAKGEEREVVVRYRAQGVGSFRYALDHNRRVENLDVEITVRGLSGSEIPDTALPTTAVEPGEAQEQFTWQYEALIADRDVELTLPVRTGFAQRIERLQTPLRVLALASPLLVVLFVACLAGLHYLGGVRLPFLYYLLAGCGYFLFYPALTFLSGTLDLALAAAVAMSAVTALLTVFLGQAAGWRRTWWQTLLLAAVFLGLFSLGLMSRWRGLLLTGGGLALVGVFMLLAARYQAAKPNDQIPMTQSQTPAPLLEIQNPQSAIPETAQPSAPHRYCPHCGAPLDETFAFCPACGHDTHGIHRCATCGSTHYAPPEANVTHCPSCGSHLANQPTNQPTNKLTN